MIILNTTDALAAFERFAHDYGTTRVTDLDNTLARIDATQQRVGSILHNGERAHRLALALIDREQALEETEVQHDILSQALGSAGLRPIVEAELDRRREQAIREHTPEMIAVLVETVAKAAKDVTRARNLMPDSDLTAANPVRVESPGHLTAWAKAKDALHLITSAIAVWHTLAASTGLVNVTQRVVVLTPATFAELEALPSRNLEGIANAGLPIKLATFDEYRTRCAAYEEAQADERRRAEAKREHRRSTAGFGAA